MHMHIFQWRKISNSFLFGFYIFYREIESWNTIISLGIVLIAIPVKNLMLADIINCFKEPTGVPSRIVQKVRHSLLFISILKRRPLNPSHTAHFHRAEISSLLQF